MQPTGATMDQVRDKMVAYAAAPNRGPVGVGRDPKNGVERYFYSGYDQQGQQEWLEQPARPQPRRGDHPRLGPTAPARSEHGQRSLTFTLHYYPQGGESSDNVTSSMQSGGTARHAPFGIPTT
jgi:hypothetical protein